MVHYIHWVNRKIVTSSVNPDSQDWPVLGELPHNKVGSKICRFCSKYCRRSQPPLAYLNPLCVGGHHIDCLRVPPGMVGPLGGCCWLVSSCCLFFSVPIGVSGGVCSKNIHIWDIWRLFPVLSDALAIYTRSGRQSVVVFRMCGGRSYLIRIISY